MPAITLNAVCPSGMEAVAPAAALIDAGRANVVVAVGQESVSLAPHTWFGSRAGRRYRAIELVDTLEHDGLIDAFEHQSVGGLGSAGKSSSGMTCAGQVPSLGGLFEFVPAQPLMHDYLESTGIRCLPEPP